MADGSNPNPHTPEEGAAASGVQERRRDWRSAPAEVWDRVRDDYLAGASARETARRHGISQSALYDRAAREGWRRIDQPWTPSDCIDALDEGVQLLADLDYNLDQVGPNHLSYVAHQRMNRAVLRGDAAGAMRWRRVRDAMDEDVAELRREDEEDEARVRAYRNRMGDLESVEAVESLESVESLEPVFGDRPKG